MSEHPYSTEFADEIDDLGLSPHAFRFYMIGKGKYRRVDVMQKRRYSTDYVYLIKAETGQYKIGLSNAPAKRFSSINSGSPVELTLIHTFPADNAKEAEELLHSDFASKHVRGEWFALDEDDVAWLCSVEGYDDGTFHASH